MGIIANNIFLAIYKTLFDKTLLLDKNLEYHLHIYSNFYFVSRIMLHALKW